MRLIGASAVLLTGLLVAGCGGEEPSPGSAAAATEAGTGGQAEASPSSSASALPVLSNARGAIGTLQNAKCPTGTGTKTFTGEIHADNSQTRDYLVTVSWVTSSGGVKGFGHVALPQVAPGEVRAFEVTAEVIGAATTCEPTVMVGTLK